MRSALNTELAGTPCLIAIVLFGPPTLYFAWRSREFRKFLAGAFFVSAGIHFYLYFAKVPVPLLGTDLVLTPKSAGGVASLFHLFLALPLLWLHQKAEGIVVELTVVPASDASNRTKPTTFDKDNA